MGVDIATYRQRIGGFHGGKSQSASSLFTSILLATIIRNLLLMAGIEPNPGPNDTEDTEVPTSTRSLKRKLFGNTDSSQGDSVSFKQSKLDKGEGAAAVPPLKGRNKGYHEGEHCGDCAVWVTLGGDPQLKLNHRSEKNMQHPKEEAQLFSSYLSINGVQEFSLRPDSCLCNGCYSDCKRNASKEDGDSTPRWMKWCDKRKDSQELCPSCFFDLLQYTPGHRTPSKFKTLRWGPKDWWHGYDVQFWTKYFKSVQPGFNIRLTADTKLCHKHYMQTYNFLKSKVCKLCSSKSSLYLIHEEDIHEIDADNIEILDWICEKCQKKRFRFNIYRCQMEKTYTHI